jgi:hypothetical protein
MQLRLSVNRKAPVSWVDTLMRWPQHTLRVTVSRARFSTLPGRQSAYVEPEACFFDRLLGSTPGVQTGRVGVRTSAGGQGARRCCLRAVPNGLLIAAKGPPRATDRAW